MNLDRELRAELHGRAATFVPPVDLLTEVRRRRDRRVRRRWAASAGVFVALMLAVLAPNVFLRHPDVPVPPSSTVRLVQPPALPDFPLTPTWEPAWAGTRSFAYDAVAGTTLRYDVTYPLGSTLTVTVGPQPASVAGQRIVVNSREATLEVGDGRVRLAWRHQQGWVLVTGTGRVNQEELLHFAESLTDAPLRMDAPFVLALVPDDAVLASFDRSSMRLHRAGEPDVALTITLVPLALADRNIDDFRGLRVVVDPTWGLTPQQLDQILQGTTATPVALTTGG